MGSAGSFGVNLHNHAEFPGNNQLVLGACCDFILIWDPSWPNEVRLSSVGGAYANAWIDANLDCGMFDFEIRLAEWAGFRFLGACDYVWSNPSGLQSACCGGECYGAVFCGWSYLTVSVVVDAYWRVGACDNLWSNLFGFRYALCGGRCHFDVFCGLSGLDMSDLPAYSEWYFGA